MMINEQQFSRMIPRNGNPIGWYSIADQFFEEAKLSTTNRIAGFMSQTAYESGDFRSIEENLNYSWKRLRQVFPRYFPTDSMARQYHRNPKAIANRVYYDPLRVNKLGNTEPNDGWTFRGGGLIQLTGRWNFTEFADDLDLDPEEAANYVRTAEGAFHSAVWFWNRNNLNTYCDQDDPRGLSIAVNGGTHGLTERIQLYERNKKIIGQVDEIPEITFQSDMLFKIGDTGDHIEVIQTELGVSDDGIFGPRTKEAVMLFQRDHGLSVDGIVGKNTLTAMGLL